MKASFENDPARGGGYGFIRLQEADISNILEHAPTFSLCRSSDALFLAATGWQEAEERLAPDAFHMDNGTLVLAVSPLVVDNLDVQQIYRLTLHNGKSTQRSSLDVQHVCYSRLANGAAVAVPLAEAATLPDATACAEAAPLPDAVACAEETTSPPLNMPQTVPQRSFSGLAVLACVLLCLAIGGVAWWFLTPQETPAPASAPTSQTEPAAPTAEPSPPKDLSANATQKSEAETPVAAEKPAAPEPAVPEPTAPEQAAPETPEPAVPEQAAPETPSVSAKEQVYAFLRTPGTPAEALALGKQLPVVTADDQDALFLLMESAAEGGNAEAMLKVARFYSPADTAPSGTIIKDPEQALIWLSKARAVPEIAEAASKDLGALRDWLQSRAANDPNAKDLLDRMEK